MISQNEQAALHSSTSLQFIDTRKADSNHEYFFQAGALLSIENAKLWLVLAIFVYFVMNLVTFLCSFYKPE